MGPYAAAPESEPGPYHKRVRPEEFLRDVRNWADEDLVFSEEINEEARANLCGIYADEATLEQLSTGDLVEAIEAIADAWQSRLSSLGQSEATFYVWLDRQAWQLRFSLISGGRTPLPFACAVDDTATLREVVESFLAWGTRTFTGVVYVYRQALSALPD